MVRPLATIVYFFVEVSSITSSSRVVNKLLCVMNASDQGILELELTGG